MGHVARTQGTKLSNDTASSVSGKTLGKGVTSNVVAGSGVAVTRKFSIALQMPEVVNSTLETTGNCLPANSNC